jgi:glycosyltransferase involved in cell wall biosynthesis
MKILFLSENFPPETNAAATRVYERAIYWVRWGYDVTVITQAPNFPHGKIFSRYKNRWRQTEVMDGITVVRVKTFIAANRGVIRRTLDFLSFMVSSFIAGLDQPKPDVICATSPQFFAAVAGWGLGAARRVPFVFELGDLWPASIAAVGAVKSGLGLRLIEKLELFLYRRSAAVAALTPSFKENLTARGIDKNKIAVVINGVDSGRYGPRPRDPDLESRWRLKDKFVVGYVGTHGMAHGLENVLAAAEMLAGDDAVRFLMVGAGARREQLIQSAKDRGLKNIIFAAAQAKENMPAVWSLCDVALVHLKDSPVFAGVIPSKIFEAMASGVAILLSAPAGEASQIVVSEGAGIHVPAGDPQALARAVRELKNDEEKRKTLSLAGLYAAAGHSREAQARKMLGVLAMAAAGHGNEVGG